ncbi:hypothetical protein MalM25_02180 [Planctomycetes bacterium MalM25]|nr:hypothetical protein MalM25_02180 [Planctomycetes bacterium MalM25]
MPTTDRSHSNAPTQAIIFVLLVAIGVVGRWGQPEWAFTPIAAIGLLAGYALPRQLAVAVPLVAMLITDLVLPSYGSAAIALAVYGAMAVTPMLGSLLRRPVGSLGAGVARLLCLAVSPALLFFVTTNFAVWAATSHYPKTAAGFVECYVAAIPFLKRMLAGDLTYTALLFAAAAVAGAYSLGGVDQQTARSPERVTA